MTKLNRFKVIFDLFPCFFVVVVIIAFVVGSLVGPDNVRHHFPLFWVLFFFLSSSFPTAIVALSFICFFLATGRFPMERPNHRSRQGVCFFNPHAFSLISKSIISFFLYPLSFCPYLPCFVFFHHFLFSSHFLLLVIFF